MVDMIFDPFCIAKGVDQSIGSSIQMPDRSR